MIAIFCDAAYSSDFFDETKNVRSFGSASLWASIGGYVGMILGVSLLQLPEIVSGIVYYIQRKRIRHESRCHSETQNVHNGTVKNQE